MAVQSKQTPHMSIIDNLRYLAFCLKEQRIHAIKQEIIVDLKLQFTKGIAGSRAFKHFLFKLSKGFDLVKASIFFLYQVLPMYNVEKDLVEESRELALGFLNPKGDAEININFDPLVAQLEDKKYEVLKRNVFIQVHIILDGQARVSITQEQSLRLAIEFISIPLTTIVGQLCY
jgi:hypothetical protein